MHVEKIGPTLSGITKLIQTMLSNSIKSRNCSKNESVGQFFNRHQKFQKLLLIIIKKDNNEKKKIGKLLLKQTNKNKQTKTKIGKLLIPCLINN